MFQQFSQRLHWYGEKDDLFYRKKLRVKKNMNKKGKIKKLIQSRYKLFLNTFITRVLGNITYRTGIMNFYNNDF